MKPNSAKKAAVTETLAAENRRLVKIRTGQHRVLGPQFPADEGGDERSGGRRNPTRVSGAAPAPLRRLDDGEHECADGGDRQAEAPGRSRPGVCSSLDSGISQIGERHGEGDDRAR